ncbi:hypothetical protein SHJG_2547 [Streptomyces hygroscopicus subsp. jinggangensis 5008]|nr:hypothetical protein SHJG_2547 [Streptomyces hygroscopicus subsp. jinggangensis 5008]AGF61977.1 hypothetical protein SHJGH_2311 [Streptomyces hygroscopicus subsp. jinggangensis TL01]
MRAGPRGTPGRVRPTVPGPTAGRPRPRPAVCGAVGVLMPHQAAFTPAGSGC